MRRDDAGVAAALDPDYVGWDMSSAAPHDRSAAIASVTGDSSRLLAYALEPLSVRVYDHRVGVVHYHYAAEVAARGAGTVKVTGRWTEVYLRRGRDWIMIAVSGRPDPSPAAAGP